MFLKISMLKVCSSNLQQHILFLVFSLSLSPVICPLFEYSPFLVVLYVDFSLLDLQRQHISSVSWYVHIWFFHLNYK